MMSGIIALKQSLRCSLSSCRTILNSLHTHHPHTPNLLIFFSTLHSLQQLYSHSQSAPTTSTPLSPNQYDMAHSVSYSPTQSIHKTHCHCITHTNPRAHYIEIIAIADCSLHTLCKMHLSCTNLSACYIMLTMASRNQSQSHTICQYSLPQCHLCHYHCHTLISFFNKNILDVVDLFWMGFKISVL